MDGFPSEAWMNAMSHARTDFFSDKVCRCGLDFRYPTEWPEPTGEVMPLPPVCARCNLWFDYTYDCQRCGQEFYHWFQHKRDFPLQWWCWNCTDEFGRKVNVHRPGLKTIRPNPATLPPGYVLYQPVLHNTDGLASAISSFRELMKGLE